MYACHLRDTALLGAFCAPPLRDHNTPLFPFIFPALQVGLDEDDARRLIEEKGGGRSAMHVQSISHWAPANIGPYSQAVKVMERPTLHCGLPARP